MYYYRGVFEYDGTSYCGFQWQKDIPTIQNELNKSIKSIVSGKMTTMGASRTDSGVHALGQVVKVTSENAMDCHSVVRLLNIHLPSQIRCLSFNPCPGDFNPAAAPLSKVYHYYFTNEAQQSRKPSRFVSNIANPLHFEAMKICVEKLVGIHDFKNFCSFGSNVKTTVREIFFCELDMSGQEDLFSHSGVFHVEDGPQPIYRLRIEGHGFLKQMIRHIVSALWMVGSGKLTVEDFSRLLDGSISKDKMLWRVAPPNGLFLVEIKY